MFIFNPLFLKVQFYIKNTWFAAKYFLVPLMTYTSLPFQALVPIIGDFSLSLLNSNLKNSTGSGKVYYGFVPRLQLIV